jgi:hypothetical protein
MINENGDIVLRLDKEKVVFKKEELDAHSEVPGYLAYERFNFNPFEIHGNIEPSPDQRS